MSNARLVVYVAAPFGRWAIAHGLAAALESQGCESSASWICDAQAAGGREVLTDEVQARAIARRNDRDLNASHVVLALRFPGEGAAMFGEVRLAIELGIPVVWCGPPNLDAMRPGVFRRGESVIAGEWEGAVKAILDAAHMCKARKVLCDDTWTRQAVFEFLHGVRLDGARRAG